MYVVFTAPLKHVAYYIGFNDLPTADAMLYKVTFRLVVVIVITPQTRSIRNQYREKR